MNIFRDPALLLAFGFGAGLSPKAPGTMGTLVAIPIYYLLAAAGFPAYVLLTLGFAVAGIWICARASTALEAHDHPGIVWDEIVGYLITMIGVPPSWLAVLLGFVLFRLFDIFKPWPIGLIDRRVGGGLGIMLDDVLAGAAAGLVLLILRSLGIGL